MINTIALVILIIIGFIIAPFMTIGIIFMISDVYTIINIIGIVIFVIGMYRGFFKIIS